MWVSNGQALPLTCAKLAPQGLRLGGLKGLPGSVPAPNHARARWGRGDCRESQEAGGKRPLPTLRPFLGGGGSSKPNADSAYCVPGWARRSASSQHFSQAAASAVPVLQRRKLLVPLLLPLPLPS